MRNRKDDIKAKGFNIVQGSDTIEDNTYHGLPTVDFNKIRVGAKILDDAILDLGTFKKVNARLADKKTVLRAIDTYNLKTMREISDFFYKTSGIYNRIIRYMAFMYRYDWFVTAYRVDTTVKPEKVTADFGKVLNTLDRFKVKKKFSDIALKVLRNGAYYGYKVKSEGGMVLQELDPNYCRTRYYYGDKPTVEFNMKFFDEKFRNQEQRKRILSLFPAEFSKGYSLYRQGKLPAEFNGDTTGWYLLNPENTVKFTATGEDYPMFISVIPLILDLDEAQELDRKKTMQRLLKIIIQKMPMDKNGELIFDVDEAQQLHNNAVQMLGKAIGIDVLTTFAEVEVADLADSSTVSAQSDDLERVERQLYNEAGVSQMQFNTDGNIALEKSVLNDAATMGPLIEQFQDFLNEIIAEYNTKPKKYYFGVELLGTTIYNYQDLAKAYKEQTQIGFSKLLPQVALGHSQSAILATMDFENEVLDLAEKMIPPMSSNTMNAETLRLTGGDGAGRPEKSDDEKSTKTLQNKESMS